MQSNIVVRLATLLKEKKLNIDCDTVVDFLNQHYCSGQWIYPDALHRSLKLHIVDVYRIMEICVDLKIVEQYLQIYCPHCQRFTGNYYRSIFDIPDDLNCVQCDNEIEKIQEHARVIYRMI